MLPLLAPWPACMPFSSHRAYASHTPGIEPLFAASPTFHPQDQLCHGHCVSSTPLHLMVWLHHYQHRSCATIDQHRSALNEKKLQWCSSDPPPPTLPIELKSAWVLKFQCRRVLGKPPFMYIQRNRVIFFRRMTPHVGKCPIHQR